MNPIYVKDGDELIVIAQLTRSAYDPLGSVAAVSQAFRVIANSFGPTLKLVSLTEVPVKLAQTEVYQGENNANTAIE